ncbi:hypothetical protein BDFB_011104 [Asbolus verrucosus]|uniref:Uncharacterized protein n=1 Tax=Asbolus verrucosus TaxID=1661398 RepID=A0A482VH95_ASBVE|nr:hypothetical protein BDFB_011104 [Asbolus verrucosus]
MWNVWGDSFGRYQHVINCIITSQY